jgi:MSHA biogenesis protein MshN
MSVINQMLQDLDKRQNQPEAPVIIGSSKPSKQSMNKVLIGILIVLLLTTIALAAIWYFRDFNQFPAFLESHAKNEQAKHVNSVIDERAEGNSEHHNKSAIQHPTNTKAHVNAAVNPSKNIAQNNTSRIKNSNIENYQNNDSNKYVQEASETNDQTKIATTQTQLTAAQTTLDDQVTKQDLIKQNLHQEDLALETQALPLANERKKSAIDKQEVQYSDDAAQITQSNSQANSEQGSMTLEPIVLNKEQLAKKKQLQFEKAKQSENMSLAIQLARELYQLSPRDVGNITQYAALLYASGDLVLAEDILKSSLAHDDDSGSLRLMLAKYYYHKNDLQRALQTLMDYRGTVESALDLVSFRAALYQKSKNAQQAYNDYSRLVAVNTNQGAWMLGLAITSEQIGKNKNALLAYQNARRIGGLSSASMRFIENRINALGGQ